MRRKCRLISSGCWPIRPEREEWKEEMQHGKNPAYRNHRGRPLRDRGAVQEGIRAGRDRPRRQRAGARGLPHGRLHQRRDRLLEAHQGNPEPLPRRLRARSLRPAGRRPRERGGAGQGGRRHAAAAAAGRSVEARRPAVLREKIPASGGEVRPVEARMAGRSRPMIALEACGVTKIYSKNGRPLEVLNVERFSVREGELITVIGPSGCGKSTFLHIIGGFIKSEGGGSIRVYGEEVSGPGPDRGMVFQEFALFPWRTVAGNVAWGLETQGVPRAQIDATVGKYLQMMNLSEFRNHYPAELSGGMKQRVALARVLAFDPKVLLMDEPFGSLDAQTRETMQEELIKLWERTRKTIVFVTHDIEEAVFLGDRVVVLTARPARIREEVRIDLPRPRDLSVKKSVQCLEYRNYIWDLIRSESQRANK